MSDQVTGQPGDKGIGRITDKPDAAAGQIGIGAPEIRAPGTNEMILFWASFLTLIAAGMGFSIRGDILAAWGSDFGFTETDKGIITGQGLAGFGITIIFFSFF